MGNPDAGHLVVFAITVAIAVFLGWTSCAVRTRIGDNEKADEFNGSTQRKWRFLLLSSLLIAGGAMICACIRGLDVTYRDASTLAITAGMAVSIGTVCQALRTKLAETRRDDSARGWNNRKWWSAHLASLVVTDTALIGLSLLLVNRIYWTMIDTQASRLAATFATLISRFALCSALLSLAVVAFQVNRCRRL